MYIKQVQFISQQWKEIKCDEDFKADKCQLALVFGSAALIARSEIFDHIKSNYPNADVMLSSTAGEITEQGVFDDSVTVTAIHFTKSRVKCVSVDFGGYEHLDAIAEYLSNELKADDLTAVFVITDGNILNGGDFLEALNKQNTFRVPVIGGMAGDGYNFQTTLAGLNCLPTQGKIIMAGLYGKELKVGIGAAGGWDEFGPERVITKSHKTKIYEIDNQKAWDLYKEYLADYVDDLSGFSLYFPLALRVRENSQTVIRTILEFNEEDKSMTFAGNVPEGSRIRLMKANFNNLIKGCATATNLCFEGDKNQSPELALMISCVGRKLILQERTEEELDTVKDIVGPNAAITGFYSYGEMASLINGGDTELHNQTICVLTLKEV